MSEELIQALKLQDSFDYLTQAIKYYFKQFQEISIISKLGQGRSPVYEGVQNGIHYAIKQYKYAPKEELEQEIENLQKLKEYDIAPIIYDSVIFPVDNDEYGAIVIMEKYDGDLANLFNNENIPIEQKIKAVETEIFLKKCTKLVYFVMILNL